MVKYLIKDDQNPFGERWETFATAAYFISCWTWLFSEQVSLLVIRLVYEVLWWVYYFSMELICVFRALLNVSWHFYSDDTPLALDPRLQVENTHILWSNQIGINVRARGSHTFSTVLSVFKDFLPRFISVYTVCEKGFEAIHHFVLEDFQSGINYKKHKAQSWNLYLS